MGSCRLHAPRGPRNAPPIPGRVAAYNNVVGTQNGNQPCNAPQIAGWVAAAKQLDQSDPVVSESTSMFSEKYLFDSQLEKEALDRKRTSNTIFKERDNLVPIPAQAAPVSDTKKQAPKVRDMIAKEAGVSRGTATNLLKVQKTLENEPQLLAEIQGMIRKGSLDDKVAATLSTSMFSEKYLFDIEALERMRLSNTISKESNNAVTPASQGLTDSVSCN